MNIQQIKQAAQTAKSRTNDKRWLAAIDKAVAGLQSGDICVTLFANGEALVTTPNGSRVVNGHCSCAAAQHGHKECYHRVAKRLAEMMEETAPVAVSPSEDRSSLIANIESAWSAKYPTDNLADNLIARFKVNQLEMLAIDSLAGVLAAIA